MKVKELISMLKRYGLKDEEPEAYLDKMLSKAYYTYFQDSFYKRVDIENALKNVEIQEQRDKIRELNEELRHKKDEINRLYEQLYEVVEQRDNWRKKKFINLDNV